MSVFTYMGTKKQLAPIIGDVCQNLHGGPFFDLFSGIAAVGTAVAFSRNIWCNDVQVFSNTLTEAMFRSSGERARIDTIIERVTFEGNKNLDSLISVVADEAAAENEGILSDDIELKVSIDQITINAIAERRDDIESLNSFHLFTSSYAGTYLSLVQAMQIDSIRYGIEQTYSDGSITFEEHRLALLALCKALSFVSNSTGHFAQYLTPSRSNIERVMAKRRRSVWDCWIDALGKIRPLGNCDWRLGNKVFSGDAIEVLRCLDRQNEAPAIIYADPPYTSDQYSRYYHLLDTLILYDYPEISGKGRYRPGRFQSRFSLKSCVEEAIEDLIASAAKLGSALVISYPTNGLLDGSLQKIPSMMRNHFSDVRDPIIIPYQHSTMGGSKGRQKEDVEECVFVAAPRLH